MNFHAKPIHFRGMLAACLALALGVLAVTRAAAQVHPFEPRDAPLQLFISGSGRVMPFHSDQVLRSGKTYSMTAIPSPGQQFIGWNRVNVFKVIETLPTETTTWVTNTQVSPIPGFIPQRTLKFQATPPVMISNEPGFRMIIGFSGWQANFSAEK